MADHPRILATMISKVTQCSPTPSAAASRRKVRRTARGGGGSGGRHGGKGKRARTGLFHDRRESRARGGRAVPNRRRRRRRRVVVDGETAVVHEFVHKVTGLGGWCRRFAARANRQGVGEIHSEGIRGAEIPRVSLSFGMNVWCCCVLDACFARKYADRPRSSTRDESGSLRFGGHPGSRASLVRSSARVDSSARQQQRSNKWRGGKPRAAWAIWKLAGEQAPLCFHRLESAVLLFVYKRLGSVRLACEQSVPGGLLQHANPLP